MNPAWMYNRLRTMSAQEIGHRVFEKVLERLHTAGFGSARPGVPDAEQGQAWAARLPTRFSAARYCQAADRVLAGNFHVFALDPCRIGFPPDWNRDPKTGVRAPMEFGKSLNYRSGSMVGNIKYLWEPNRHLEAVTLAQAWHLSADSKYAHGCRKLVDSWIEQCPYPSGANWSSSLELGIRLVNWSFAWHLLGGESSPVFSDDGGKGFRRRWLEAIYQHCHFVARYPSLHSSANNHLLGEQLGLLVGSLTWPKWAESAGWARAAHTSFEQQALLQNSPDGVNREQGIWYHHEVTDMMIIAGIVARANGVDFSSAFWKRLESMLEFTASVMDVGGNVPAFGDSDDAVIVRFNPERDYPVFRSQLATGAVLFNRGDFKALALSFDDKSRWLLGDAAAGTYDALSPRAIPGLPRRDFAEGGYYILGSKFGSVDEVRIVADAGPLGYLSIAAHGHADALSFTMSVGGEEFLVDPGTYAYHTDAEWRAYFRGTSAHNTLRVDGANQSVPGGNFMWLQHARARCESLDLKSGHQVLLASHDGYLRLEDPVVHQREFRYSEADRTLRVRDWLHAKGNHRFELFLHFSEICSVVLSDSHADVAGSVATLRVNWPEGMQPRLARGEHSPPLGWISRRFDEKATCSALVFTGESRGEWQGTTTIRIMQPAPIAHE